MNIPAITAFSKRYKHRQLSAMMRGYRVLRANNLLPRIMDAQIALVEMPLGIPEGKIPSYLFGSAADKANEAIRDFLITRVGQYSLNKSLLISMGQKEGWIVYPLPGIWRKKIRSLGWRISEIKSALMWQGFLFFCFFYGAFLLTKNLLLAVIFSLRKKPNNPEKSVYFEGLTENNFPQQKSGDSYDIISWYLKWQGREMGIKTIGHNVKKSPERIFKGVNVLFMDPLEPVKGVGKTLRLFLWGCVAAALCLFDMLRGHWWSPLMFAPCVQAFIAKHQPTFAIDYLFHNSNSRKPLWLYEAEAKGAKTTLYFYSTNCDSFMTNENVQPVPAYYRNMMWNRYLVWDEEQADFLVRSGHLRSKIEVVDPIWFSESDEELPEMPEKTLGVFDIQPRRHSVYVYLGAPFEYYVPKVAISFLRDIIEEAAHHGWHVAWKAKRSLSGKEKNLASRSYQNEVLKMLKNKNLIAVYPSISAKRIIQKCKMVISIPFTSTSILAKDTSLPSFFYDPTGLLSKNDRAAHGIPLISGKEELKKLLASN